MYYGSFTLAETDSGTDSDSDSKPLYYAEHVHIAQTQTGIPTPYFFVGQESESESVSGNVNEPLELCRNNQLQDVTRLVHKTFLHQFSDVQSRFYACNV